MASPYFLLGCRLVLGGAFLYAGATKVLDPGSLAASIRTYELGLPEWFISASAHVLPPLEILLGLYLALGLFTRATAWVTSGLLAVFTLALLQGALRGLEIDCGCFGPAKSGATSLWFDVARDLALLALSLGLALRPPNGLNIGPRSRRRGSTDRKERSGSAGAPRGR